MRGFVTYMIAWFKSKNITSHTVAAFLIVFATAYSSNLYGVRDLCIELFKNHPTIPADTLLLCGLILKYTHSSSPAGTIATAESILALPGAPTTKEIVDAKVTK
jgi:hypothetical protein